MSEPAKPERPPESPAGPEETPEQRKARLDARDRELTRRCLAREPQALREMTGRLYRRFELCCQRHTPGLLEHLDEIRGQALMLFGRWLEEGRIREDESIPYLARRIWSQASRAFLVERDGQKKNVPIVQLLPTEEEGTPYYIERALAESQGAATPEERLAECEAARWLERARERMTPGERPAFDGELAVDAGEAASLAEYLGVKDAAARKQRERMREKIVALARADGCEELLERALRSRRARKG